MLKTARVKANRCGVNIPNAASDGAFACRMHYSLCGDDGTIGSLPGVSSQGVPATQTIGFVLRRCKCLSILLGSGSAENWLSVRLTGALLGKWISRHDPLGDGFRAEDTLIGH
jgi:hypothetical protein